MSFPIISLHVQKKQNYIKILQDLLTQAYILEFRALINTSASLSDQISRYMSPRQQAKHHYVGTVQLLFILITFHIIRVVILLKFNEIDNFWYAVRYSS